MNSDKASSVRAVAAASPAPALSPIVQLLPTGYRDIQPFQRGQGWHSNGKLKRRAPPERVVFPALATAPHGLTNPPDEAVGPSSSQVELYGAVRQDDDQDDAREREHAVQSPPASAIPVAPPSRPHRPSSGSASEGNQRASSSASFRTRALAASLQTSSVDKARDDVEEDEPDPARMEQLWQEYNERTKHPTKTVDAETYHRKMQRRYNETKALRERIMRLEMELEDAQRERDEALEAAQRSAQEAVKSKKWKDPEVDDPVSGLSGVASEVAGDETATNTVSPRVRNSFASIAARVSVSHKQQQHRKVPFATVNPEEVSYREKAAKMERSMATAKEGIAQLQARLVAMHETDQQTIESLRAQLELEQRASKLLSVQLRETNAAFRSTTDELVSTQVALEKEQIEKQIVVEQIQAETRQLISDQRRKELQSRVKNVVRTLGKEALHQKMEALHTRVMTAEHHMRVAQLEVVRLKQERELQQQRIDDILSSREIKYHCLASRDGGIPGILQRATTLYQGTRTVNDQFLLVHMLYEDQRGPVDAPSDPATNEIDPPSDLDDGYCIHILVYDAFTAQDDYLTFHLRDIRRLVPDATKYLARFADRKHQRFLELAELLFKQCHVGYKNGHIVLTERPSTQAEAADREKREVVIYRGSRFLRSKVSSTDKYGGELLVDLVINEVHDPSTSQLWWIEIQGCAVDMDTNQELDSHLTIDSLILKSIVPVFASYRPSESIDSLSHGNQLDGPNAFGIHEDLLEPLFDKLEWRRVGGAEDGKNISGLLLLDSDGVSILGGISASKVESDHDEAESNQELKDDDSSEPDGTNIATAASSSAPRVLDHRSIVSVGATFFCIWIEEVWDGELMLRVTMEEPDDVMCRYQAVLPEKDVAAIAAHLFKSGLCETDHSLSIKFGLPASLHDPLCRLLKKHAQPALNWAAATTKGQGNIATRRISFESLLREVHSVQDPQNTSDSVPVRTLTLPEASVIDRKRVEQVSIIGDAINDKDVHDLLTTFSREKRKLHAERTGCRSEATPAFALAAAYSGFAAPFEGMRIIEVRHLHSANPTSSSDSTVAVSRLSFQDSLPVLGLRSSFKTE